MVNYHFWIRVLSG
ncbi:hypothetical protein F383_23148 [Gossypium arboreum]|uniref:Uncharacterized protein n=1 Tax=Gossypium arboreum TaxID=29729 RepID=A0A0B0P4J7_GOSAR|nr:hypothetical protein F383_23148 [Gossypium arboreum]